MIEEDDDEEEDRPGEMDLEWEGNEGELFLARDGFIEEEEDFLLEAGRAGGDLLTQALGLTEVAGGRKGPASPGPSPPHYAALQPAMPGGRDGMLEELLARPPGASGQM
jgi:hypothetical protein